MAHPSRDGEPLFMLRLNQFTWALEISCHTFVYQSILSVNPACLCDPISHHIKILEFNSY
jgi:hypothetical protein